MWLRVCAYFENFWSNNYGNSDKISYFLLLLLLFLYGNSYRWCFAWFDHRLLLFFCNDTHHCENQALQWNHFKAIATRTSGEMGRNFAIIISVYCWNVVTFAHANEMHYGESKSRAKLHEIKSFRRNCLISILNVFSAVILNHKM